MGAKIKLTSTKSKAVYRINTYGSSVTRNTYYDKFANDELKSIFTVTSQTSDTSGFGFTFWIGTSSTIYAHQAEYQGQRIHIEITEPYLYEGAYLNCPYRASLDSNPQIALQKNDVFSTVRSYYSGGFNRFYYQYYSPDGRTTHDNHIEYSILIDRGLKRRYFLYEFQINNAQRIYNVFNVMSSGESDQTDKYNCFTYKIIHRMVSTTSVYLVHSSSFNEMRSSTYCPITFSVKTGVHTGFAIMCLEIDTTNISNFSYDISILNDIYLSTRIVGDYNFSIPWEDIS